MPYKHISTLENAMPSFEDLKLKPELLQRLQELQFQTPTPIQEAAIPVLLAGQDLAGQAETGSGKTAAYGLPILQKVKPEVQQVQALIIVPTRELAVQVRQELKQLAQRLPGLKISAFYGGHAFSQERASLAFPPQVLIGTPGRLTDHLHRRTLSLGQVTQVVLDEADKVLEMGFQEELDEVLAALPRSRQTILFSATLSEGVKELISRSLQDPKFVQVSAQVVPEQVRFVGIRAGQGERLQVLRQLVSRFRNGGTVVFVNTRATADALATELQDLGQPVKALHGGMEQPDRDKTMVLFRNGTVPVLVATDLAARGLDVADLQTIVHYELPDDEESFLHRSGRTGRAGGSGTVYVLASDWEERKLQGWEQVPLLEWLPAETFLESPDPAAALTAPAAPALATLHINGGRKDKLSPRDIVGALVAEAGLAADQIGKIEVQDRISFVAVPAAQSKAIAARLSEGKIKGRKFKVSLVR
jgi:ATP-dependent RNA helicase DbpA